MNLYSVWRRLVAVRARRGAVIVTVLGLASVATADEQGFLAENSAAMARMMAAMSIVPSGDVDRDFVAAMLPHHQGAIEMARAQLRYGHNEQLRRIAQEIIIEQTQEIAAMRLALGEPADGHPWTPGSSAGAAPAVEAPLPAESRE